MFSRTGLGTLARGALLSARVPCVSSRSGADVLILCRHCRPHRRREDRHQQGPGGVPEPPADGGGPGHRGVHHTLHRQPEAGGAPACGSKLCAPGGRLAQRGRPGLSLCTRRSLSLPVMALSPLVALPKRSDSSCLAVGGDRGVGGGLRAARTLPAVQPGRASAVVGSRGLGRTL